jgi:hypothetical protein
VEASPAGKLEGGYNDASARGHDCCFGSLQIRGVKHDQRRGLGLFLLRRALGKTDGDPGVSCVAVDVIRTPILETPAEDGGVELLGPFDVGGGEFDVSDLVVQCGIADGFSPLR